MCKEKLVLIGEIIILINNITFFFNQNPTNLVEMGVLLILGYQ